MTESWNNSPFCEELLGSSHFPRRRRDLNNKDSFQISAQFTLVSPKEIGFYSLSGTFVTRTLRYLRAKPKRSQSYVRWIRSPSPSRCLSVVPDLVRARPRRACIDPRLLKRQSRRRSCAVLCGKTSPWGPPHVSLRATGFIHNRPFWQTSYHYRHGQ